jgi:hypothetical protein
MFCSHEFCNIAINLAVNSMFFIWNDNMREKREATPLHASTPLQRQHADTHWFMIDHAVMAYKGTETDIICGMEGCNPVNSIYLPGTR